ncbi:MAG: hypothetical protein JSW11_14690, partial [Candidatus Heimdallarchaeota archaeon]
MKRYKMMFFLFLLLIFVVQSPLSPMMAESQTSGTFYGFDWEYGEEKRNFTKSVEFADSFSESEERTVTRSYTRNAHIRTGLETQDIFWERWTNRSKAAPSSTWELPGSPQNWLGYRADGYLTNASGPGGAWYRYAGITIHHWPNNSQALNISWFGRQIDVGLADSSDHWWTPEPTWWVSYVNSTFVRNETIPMKDWLGTIHDYVDIAIYHITYSYDGETPSDPSDDEIIFEELLIPRFLLVRVETKVAEVSVNETVEVAASLSGQFNFSGTWEENLFGQHVS